MKKIISLVLLIVWLIGGTAKTAEPVKMEVYPRIALALGKRATVHVTVRIDPAIYSEYDWLEVDWFYGRSIQNTNGKVVPFDRFIELPPGTYTLRATLKHLDETKGKRIDFISTVNIEIQ